MRFTDLIDLADDHSIVDTARKLAVAYRRTQWQWWLVGPVSNWGIPDAYEIEKTIRILMDLALRKGPTSTGGLEVEIVNGIPLLRVDKKLATALKLKKEH